MKFLARLTFGAVALAGAAMATAQPANAATSFSFSYGYGGAYGGPHVAVHYNPCNRPYYGRPRYCHYPLHYGRVFFGGAWHHGPFHYRHYRGYRQYWHGGRWHRGALHAGPRLRRGFSRGHRGHYGPRRSFRREFGRGGGRGFGRGHRRGYGRGRY